MMKRCNEKNNNEHTEGRREGKEGRETRAEYRTYLDNSYAGL